MEGKRAEILRIIKDTRSIPTLPGIISKLNSLTENNKASVQEMAKVVSADQVLSAKVLRLANSPSYGFSRISTISNAMILLGTNVVKSLVLSSSIFEIMEKSVVGLWEHSIGAGVAANIIARRLRLQECEEISTAALLHDIGKVIIKIKFESEFDQIQSVITETGRSITEAERMLLEMDHAEVGEWLARSWFLPEKLIEPISCHHRLEKSLQHRTKTAVVHLADVMIEASGFGYSGDVFVPVIQPLAVDLLNINESMLCDVAEELEDKLVEVKNFTLEIQSSDEP